ncbi:hypothetical protein P0D75_38765 [Paraburkholderia sediminicola]|uniref:hypothetical protein n=1 Tax=Paraburkholderia sediminicola TaxID=458836 RepID=UPI0038BDA334
MPVAAGRASAPSAVCLALRGRSHAIDHTGLPKASVYALVDINTDAVGAKLTSYTYYRTTGASKIVDEIIGAINDPKTCT